VHPEQIAMALLKSRYAEEERKSDESDDYATADEESEKKNNQETSPTNAAKISVSPVAIIQETASPSNVAEMLISPVTLVQETNSSNLAKKSISPVAMETSTSKVERESISPATMVQETKTSQIDRKSVSPAALVSPIPANHASSVETTHGQPSTVALRKQELLPGEIYQIENNAKLCDQEFKDSAKHVEAAPTFRFANPFFIGFTSSAPTTSAPLHVEVPNILQQQDSEVEPRKILKDKRKSTSPNTFVVESPPTVKGVESTPPNTTTIFPGLFSPAGKRRSSGSDQEQNVNKQMRTPEPVLPKLSSTTDTVDKESKSTKKKRQRSIIKPQDISVAMAMNSVRNTSDASKTTFASATVDVSYEDLEQKTSIGPVAKHSSPVSQPESEALVEKLKDLSKLAQNIGKVEPNPAASIKKVSKKENLQSVVENNDKKENHSMDQSSSLSVSRDSMFDEIARNIAHQDDVALAVPTVPGVLQVDKLSPTQKERTAQPMNMQSPSSPRQPTRMRMQRPRNPPHQTRMALPHHQPRLGSHNQQPRMGPPSNQPRMGPSIQQPRLGPHNQQLRLGPPNQQSRISPPNQQPRMSPPSNQARMSQLNQQPRLGPRNQQPRMGLPNQQPRIGPPNQQPRLGPYNQQPKPATKIGSL